MSDNIYDVIIIGAGPAGLTSAIFSARYGLKTVVLEKLVPGGQIARTDIIENYPGFKDGLSGVLLAEKFEKHAKKYDIDFKSNEVLDFIQQGSSFLVKTENDSIKGLSVIIATGAHPRKISVPGEDRLMGKGVSYCATCDGFFYKDKDVVVVGGGNTAVEEALYLSKIAKSVKLVHRRNDLRAVESYKKRIENADNIEKIFKMVPVEIIGKDTVEAVKLKNVSNDKEIDVECDGIFIFVGYIPNSKLIDNIVDVDDKRYVLTDDNMKTSCEGIFAAGDIRSKSLRQVVTACADGAVASESAFRYISRLKGTAYSGWDGSK